MLIIIELKAYFPIIASFMKLSKKKKKMIKMHTNFFFNKVFSK